MSREEKLIEHFIELLLECIYIVDILKLNSFTHTQTINFTHDFS